MEHSQQGEDRTAASYFLRHVVGAGVLAVVVVGGVARFQARSERMALITTTIVSRMASALAVDARSGHVFVTNSTEATVSMLDARTGRVLQIIPVGGYPDQVQVNPRTERVFVLNETDNSISVIDARTGRIRATLALGVGGYAPPVARASTSLVFDSPAAASPGVGGAQGVSLLQRLLVVRDAPSGAEVQTLAVPPYGWELAVDSTTGHLLVPLPVARSMSRIDVLSGQSVATIAGGPEPVAIAVDTQIEHAFVVNANGGTVRLLDSRSGRVLRTVAVGRDPALVAVDAPAGRVLVVHGWGGFQSADQARRRGHGTDVLDARTGAVLATVAAGAVAPDPHWLTVHPQDVAVDPERGHSFVLDGSPKAPWAGRLSVLDDHTARVLRSLPVDGFPVAVAVDPQDARLFVLTDTTECSSGPSFGARLPAAVRRWLPFLAAPSVTAPADPHACSRHSSVAVFDLARL